MIYHCTVFVDSAEYTDFTNRMNQMIEVDKFMINDYSIKQVTFTELIDIVETQQLIVWSDVDYIHWKGIGTKEHYELWAVI